MPGFLLPPTYTPPPTLPWESALANAILALFLTLAVLLAIHLVRLCRRRRRVPLYLAFAWLDLAAAIIHASLGWCVGHGRCPAQPSLWLFLGIILSWSVERHCLAQILANRVGVLLPSGWGRRFKCGVFWGTFVLTTSVVVVWTPGTMEISPGWVRANEVWDRGEKVCFLAGDVALNGYFVHVVRSELVRRCGLERYARLWRVNVGMVVVTVLLDAAVVGSTWIPDYWIYVQFRPLVHLVKLYIELCNAEFIGKVASESVRARCGSLDVEVAEVGTGREGDVEEGRIPRLAPLEPVYSPGGSLEDGSEEGDGMNGCRVLGKKHQHRIAPVPYVRYPR
ncbi:hypothetical protein QBC39DRAFT_383285 [Podospora conica]|nr:hypothetical protein QBC39DRAFT_383285 [Schizothecium conicum]